MTRIAHASGDENGNAKGGQAGDQKDEIGIRAWYDRKSWEVCLVPTDPETAAVAVQLAIQIAQDNSFGYDQSERWTGYNAILAAGGDIANAEASEFDCSSFVDTCYILAGLKVERGYTGNAERRYLATGKFVAHREPEYLTSPDYAPKGSLYLTAGKHIAILIDDGVKVETTTVTPDPEVSYVEIIGQVNVRNLPGRTSSGKLRGKVLYVAEDEKLEYLGKDFRTGWYRVRGHGVVGFVSNEIPRYAKLVIV